MKTVVCIRNTQYHYDKPDNWELTIGKSYDVVNSAQDGWYFVTNNLGQLGVISKDWFMNISEYRTVQLNKLGI